jgi:hypothetical protein
MSTILTLTMESPKDADLVLTLLTTADSEEEFEGVFTVNRKEESDENK